jgi:outer membrane protein OmpA-like peptidoglycan-associated protein
MRLCLALLVLALCLSACQTVPAPRRFTDAQIATLIKAGFTETEDGWGLDLSGQILFATDTDQLTEQASGIIEKVTQALHIIEIDSVRVDGHTDNTGSPDYNLMLSERRAEAVAREVARHGIPASRIVRRGFGSARPIADNATPEGRAQNRRVAIIVPGD